MNKYVPFFSAIALIREFHRVIIQLVIPEFSLERIDYLVIGFVFLSGNFFPVVILIYPLIHIKPDLIIVDGGSEFTTSAGRLDILAEDSKGNLVVIELKAGRATSNVIAQILAYMSTGREEKNKPGRGILVAGEFDDRVKLAAKAVPTLELRKYAYSFQFGTVD